jgi:beta-glucosidase
MSIKRKPADWGALAVDTPLTPTQIEAKAKSLLAQMSLNEKVRQMSGDLRMFPDGISMFWAYNRTPIPAGENRRLNIPGIRFSDGPRGVVLYRATCFPVSMARGAAWDIDLEERIGDAIGVEARSLGANYYGGVCINLLRHPAWGRAQETYGEDPYLLGELGAALTRGVQRHIMACAKHYALNSIENARFKVDVQVDERTLREVYLPHFKRCVDAGVASVMSAYNRVRGEWCSQHAFLLRSILKEEWVFEGFVLSDFAYAVHDARAAILGGLDVEMPFVGHYRRHLAKLVKSGEVPEALVDEAVLRILRQKIRFAQVGEPQRYKPEAVLCKEHIQLAREAAQKSIVLLKNEPPAVNDPPLLPLDRSHIRRMAVIGQLANLPNTGDHGSSQARPPTVVTPLQGLRAAAGEIEVSFADGENIPSAVLAAQRADVVVIVAGYSYKDEGEYFKKPLQPPHGGDRDLLTLHPHDEDLIQSVAQANPHTVVALVGGSAIITEAWRAQVPAILMTWYAGMEGGHALADVLFGAVNPSGKLPCTFPKSTEQLPFFDKNVDQIEYGYYHGYRLFEKNQLEGAFPFGYGLSYTQYQYRDLRLEGDLTPTNGSVQVSVQVSNVGKRAGEEIVQLYVGCRDTAVDRPLKALKGFRRVALQPGETKTVSFELQPEDLAYYDVQEKRWAVEPAEYSVYVGASSREEDLLAAGFRVLE